MDVDGFTAHTLSTFAHGFNLNEIVVIGREGELHGCFVGHESGDVIEAVSLQQHLRQETNMA